MIKMTSVEAQNGFGKLLDTVQRETVAITRHGRPAAFVVSPREMEELLDARRRRSEAVAWSELARKNASPGAAALTDEDVTRLVDSLSKIADAYADLPIEEGMAAIEAAVERERRG
jgi:antitoxin Phd